MEWNKLLSTKRARKSESAHQKDDKRSEFERDYDRIIFFSSFRRLQGKAQVFPLESNDFVRTRLTHSIEVSTIGRSLALDVARQLAETKKVLPEQISDIGTIVAIAGLVHDVGNPPFGHSGEGSIRTWFAKKGKEYLEKLTNAEKKDFELFDGNAQGLRIIAHLQMLKDEHGANLTFGTMAAGVKYPCSSEEADKESNKKKKFGFFQSEKKLFQSICDETGLNGRHPLALLMEAADDIAYSAVDIEDAVKKGILLPEQVIEFLKEELKDSQFLEIVSRLEKNNTDYRKESRPDPFDTSIQLLRIEAHAEMIRASAKSYIKHYDNIMSGKFDGGLVESSESKQLYKALKKLAQNHVYSCPSVIMLECVGKEVIHGLLDRLIPAALSGGRDDTRTHDGRLFNLMSHSLRFIEQNYRSHSNYSKMQLVCDFICGMTDIYAVDFYRRLTGMKI